MTDKKRGLGRGLEALLADDQAKGEKHQPQAMPQAHDNRMNVSAIAGEAETLRKLIEEFESIVRTDLS